jgi:hypothetical protein
MTNATTVPRPGFGARKYRRGNHHTQNVTSSSFLINQSFREERFGSYTYSAYM